MFDEHPKLILPVTTISLIAAWVGAMYLLVFVGFPQNWIIIVAPVSSVVAAGLFLYIGRDKIRGAPATEKPVLELDGPVIAADASLENPVIAADASLENPVIAADASLENPVIAADASLKNPVIAVNRSKQEIERLREELRCIIIAAPSHGVLQDRLNNWLSGGYGHVTSTSMAMNEKGFYLTVFYEPAEVQ